MCYNCTMKHVALGIGLLMTACSQWAPEDGPITGKDREPLLSGGGTSVPTGNGSITFLRQPWDDFGQLTYLVRVDTAEPDPLLANTCTLQLTTTSVNGYVRVQRDGSGFYDGDLVSSPIMSGSFVYEQDRYLAPMMTVDIICTGLPNTAVYSYYVSAM